MSFRLIDLGHGKLTIDLLDIEFYFVSRLATIGVS